jgi:arsenate reductase (thioredoxin)
MERKISAEKTSIRQTVLFICTHNSGRSQMAEAFFNKYAPPHVRALSAGSQPAERLNRTVVNAMKELDIDIIRQQPKLLTVEMLDSADIVVTMGCGADKACPAAFVDTEDWQLDDPEGQPIDKVRQIRDAIEALVKQLIEKKFNEKLTSL